MNGLNGHAANGGTNGYNGASSSSSSASSSSNGTRQLQLVHSESSTRLAIPNIPESIFGLAVDLRAEFFDLLKENGNIEKLIPDTPAGGDEGEDEEDGAAAGANVTSNHSALLLMGYWLEFLVQQHSATRPIQAASLAYFRAHFLANDSKDLHSLVSKLDVDEKKLVLSSFIALSVRVYGDDPAAGGAPEFGPPGKLWSRDFKTSIYAVFGGQGSNEYYWDEMEVSGRLRHGTGSPSS